MGTYTNPVNRTSNYTYQGSIRPMHKRLLRVAFLLIIISISFSCGALIHAYASNGSSNEAGGSYTSNTVFAATVDMPKEVTVVTGDTLWGIAKVHAPKNQDIREYIYQIQKINGLKTSVLHNGQKLILP
jgi:LysM repeat protein